MTGPRSPAIQRNGYTYIAPAGASGEGCSPPHHFVLPAACFAASSPREHCPQPHRGCFWVAWHWPSGAGTSPAARHPSDQRVSPLLRRAGQQLALPRSRSSCLSPRSSVRSTKSRDAPPAGFAEVRSGRNGEPDAFLSCSDHLRPGASGAAGDDTPVETVYYGIDTARFSPDRDSPAPAAPTRSPADRPIVLYLAQDEFGSWASMCSSRRFPSW